MQKDKLFLLKGDFMDGNDGPFYCPECIAIEGLLSYFPKLRDEVDVVYVDFAKPRPAMTALLGTDNQNAPTLVLGEIDDSLRQKLAIKTHNGLAFLDNEDDILRLLNMRYHASKSH